MECVSSISRHCRSTRCRTALTRRQRSASAKRQRVRMESLERSIRQIHSPPSIGGSTRSRNSVLRWEDRASSLVPAVANTPRRQRDCAAPCCSPPQTSFCEQHLSDPYLGAPLRAPVPSLTLGSCLVPASTAVLHASLSSAFFSLRQVVISSALGNERTAKFEYVGRACQACSSVPCAKQGAGEAVAGSMATNTHHCAKGVDRNSTTLFWLSMFIGGPAMHNRSLLDLIIADIDTPLLEPALVAKRLSL